MSISPSIVFVVALNMGVSLWVRRVPFALGRWSRLGGGVSGVNISTPRSSGPFQRACTGGLSTKICVWAIPLLDMDMDILERLLQHKGHFGVRFIHLTDSVWREGPALASYGATLARINALLLAWVIAIANSRGGCILLIKHGKGISPTNVHLNGKSMCIMYTWRSFHCKSLQCAFINQGVVL